MENANYHSVRGIPAATLTFLPHRALNSNRVLCLIDSLIAKRPWTLRRLIVGAVQFGDQITGPLKRTAHVPFLRLL